MAELSGSTDAHWRFVVMNSESSLHSYVFFLGYMQVPGLGSRGQSPRLDLDWELGFAVLAG